jgi:hypothetical protein
MGIVEAALRLAGAVGVFREHARGFYYAVVLSQHPCPACGGKLAMIREGACCCRDCGNTFDPTIAFQRCSSCGGSIRLVLRRYRCRQCGSDVSSQFLFDGLVFDPSYFRGKMALSRQRKREQRERIRRMLAESRSGVIDVPGADLASIPGLAEALNGLSAEAGEVFVWQPRKGFDLARYQSHIEAHLGPFAVSLEDIPALEEDRRRDRIWRFIALIFLCHAGRVDLQQDGPTILIIPHETYAKGQGLPGDPEGADGLERSLGGIEA